MADGERENTEADAATGVCCLRADAQRQAAFDSDGQGGRAVLCDFVLVLALEIFICSLAFVKTDAAWRDLSEAAAGAAAIFWGGRRILRGAWKPFYLVHANTAALIAISSVAGWLTVLLRACGVRIPSFCAAGVMTILLSLAGRCAETCLRRRASLRVKGLLSPVLREVRLVLADDGEVLVSPDVVEEGSLIRVAPGERMPFDGVVTQGASSVDESMLTGEAMPVVKDLGSDVRRGSVNLSGAITVRITRLADVPLQEAASERHAVQREPADGLALELVPGAVILALISGALWYFFYDEMLAALMPLAAQLPWPVRLAARSETAACAFLATLVAACPGALGLSAPLAFASDAAEAARAGLLVRNEDVWQSLRQVNFALLDKTGTITQGKPSVVAAELPDEACGYVLALESCSHHHLSTAIGAYLRERLSGQPCGAPDSVSSVPGEGIYGRWGSDEWFIGRARGRACRKDSLHASECFVEVRRNGAYIGCLTVADPLRADSREAVFDLRAAGAALVMATGDNMDAAIECGRAAGLENIRWEVRAAGKLALVHGEQSRGRVVMAVGDGLNDAAAIRAADVGVALIGGMDAALEGADLVILEGGLSKVAAAFRIAAKSRSVIRWNLVCAFFFSIITVPFAMAGLLHPAAAAAATAAGAIAVMLNSLRVAGSAGNKTQLETKAYGRANNLTVVLK